jgi:hypothetical protein
VEKPGATSIILLYAALALLTVPVFPHFLSPNEFSRWIVAAAIVDYHTLEVTPVNTRFGGRIEDLSKIDSRLYSNKAPGVALLGLPAYAALRVIVGPPDPANSRITLTAMRWIASTLPTVLLAWMMLRAGRRFGVSEPALKWVLAVLLFATPMFAYGMLLFSHALTAFALFGTWTLLFTDTFGRRPALAGIHIGGRPRSISDLCGNLVAARRPPVHRRWTSPSGDLSSVQPARLRQPVQPLLHVYGTRRLPRSRALGFSRFARTEHCHTRIAPV